MLQFTTGRRYNLGASLAALALIGSSSQLAEAFRTQRPDDIAFSHAVKSPFSMVDTQWGSDYTAISGTTSEDGSMDFIFVNSVEGAVVEQVESIFLPPEMSCAVVGSGLSELQTMRFLTLTEIPTLGECQGACSKTLSCKAAQFDEKSSTCALLKGVRGSLETKKGNTVVLPSCETDCFFEGEKLTGAGTALGTAPNANMCQALCDSDPACKGFTYKPSTQECLSFADDTDFTEDADAISGSKTSCTPHVQTTDYTGSCTIENRTGAHLPELQVVYNVDTYEQCQELCLKNPKCNFLTHNKPDRRCYVKPGMGDIIFSKAGDTTGPRLCDGTCFLKDIELTGRPYHVVGDCLSANFCHYECSMDTSCDMWTYEEKTKTCSLLTKTEDVTGKRSPGFWTGPKTPCSKDALYTLAASSCALRGVKIGNGSPLASSTQETPAQCQTACQNLPVCEAYTYDIRQKKCDLFLASAVRQKEENLNFISGPRVCAETCFKQNTDYVGTLLEQLSTGFKTPDECQLRCQATTNCAYWSFHATQKVCKLLSTDTTRAATGVVGGPKYCDGGCDIPGYALKKFGWTRSLNTNGIDACRNACKSDQNCYTFSYTDKCNLFDAFAFMHFQAQNGAHTGWKSCSSCFRAGFGYKADSSAVLMSLSTQNAEQCRQRCAYMDHCTRFSFDAISKECTLLSGETEDVTGTNLISGPAECSNNTTCFKTDTNYDKGTLVRQRTAQSANQCQEFCQETPECTAFNYNNSSKMCNLIKGRGFTPQTSKGSTAGMKKCITLGQELCLDEGMDYSYSDIFRSPYGCKTGECCRNKCLEEPRCQVILWEPGFHQCWVKYIDAYKKRGKRAKVSSTIRTGCPYCALWKKVYNGRVVGTTQTTTQAQCQIECQLLDTCKFFTFGPNKSCKLFADEGYITDATQDDVYSAPREC